MLTVQPIAQFPLSEVTDRRDRTAQAAPTVLVATSLDEASAVALHRGFAFARALGASVTVLHVVRPPSWLGGWMSRRASVDADAIQRQLTTAISGLRSWCTEVLGADAQIASVILKRGRVDSAILEAARETRAPLIVLGDCVRPDRLGNAGGVGARVITHASVPVLVARPPRPGAEILAATNLVDASYPTLRAAARFGVRLGARVTFMHNVEASGYVAEAKLLGIPVRATVRPRDVEVDERAHDLAWLARYIGTDIETVVTRRERSVDAIMDVARSRDADILVVGARRRHDARIFGSTGAAVSITCEARRSVLVVPLMASAIARQPS